ncbi:hypothetical protein C2S52_008965 [Perilla frutescens var. hirtella]|uniref:Late embryogenesis abundant protein LEA-2 subgroup domain-containing protein n=1 Tax=Perilla frutescens var. hirtella TaxID=608512 RepID=A0AAD4JK95_PERFH|nr:hypothetical protein C2S51_017501 [Perilla frutescens var. frutescens]KAH6784006.1 hypothetical protein C2S52_008965 [Perilla frutescens var. hirtella]KAH6835026.1 hypothetical protein C2S53_011633 [Perilla frutescens var. hirtella]
MPEKDHHIHEFGAPAEARELRRRKRKRCLLYIVLFAVFQTGIILLFALTVMKIRTPKFRVSSVAFGAFDYSAAAANPSFNIMAIVELSVKNTNFGHYKFQSTTVYFYYNGAVVGSAYVPSWRARARSTRRITVEVQLSSAGLVDRVQLANDLSAGVLPVNSRSTVDGKVELMKLVKKKKSAEMECFIAINVVPRTVGYLSCE